MTRDRDDGFTGLAIEPHQVLAGLDVCVAYRKGKRVGVLYFNGERLRLVYEEDVECWVEERIGPAEFVRHVDTGEKPR
jgi:hypothetical protein